ncbi:hypothetical protein D3C76_940910 [compost metagenome]
MQIAGGRHSPETDRQNGLDQHVGRHPQIVTLQHQRRVIDRHERNDETGQGNAHRPQADLEPAFLGDGGRGKAGEGDRWCQVGENAEIEHEHVRHDQWHTQFQQGRCCDRAGDDVVGDGRDAHAQHQAGNHRQYQ